MAEAREAHIAGQPDMDIAKLVFIDETGVTTNMIRRYGRAPNMSTVTIIEDGLMIIMSLVMLFLL